MPSFIPLTICVLARIPVSIREPTIRPAVSSLAELMRNPEATRSMDGASLVCAWKMWRWAVMA